MSQLIHSAAIASRRSAEAVAAAMPLAFPRVPAFTFAPAKRFWVSILFLAIGVAAVVSYVVAVNAMLFSGAAVEGHRQALRTLVEERSRLQGLAARQHAPLWLEEASRTQGMVAADGVRYLRGNDSLAQVR